MDAYPDPLTGNDPWTIGYGHTGREVHVGLSWGEPYAEIILNQDIAVVKKGMFSAIPWWTNMPDLRQDVLVNMGFNLGVNGLLKFHNTLADCKEGLWDVAAEGILDSLAARQLPKRYGRLAEQMRTGVHQS